MKAYVLFIQEGTCDPRPFCMSEMMEHMEEGIPMPDYMDEEMKGLIFLDRDACEKHWQHMLRYREYFIVEINL